MSAHDVAGGVLPAVRGDELDRLCRTVVAIGGEDAALLVLWDADRSVSGSSGLDGHSAEELADLLRPADPGEGDRSRSAAVTSFRRRLDALGYSGGARVPIAYRGVVVGLLAVFDRSGARPDARLLEALGRVCESAIEYAQEPGTVPAPTDLDSIALATETYEGLLAALARMLSDRLGGVGVGLSIADEDTGLLVTADGSFGLDRSVTRRFPIDPGDLHSNAARVFELRQPFVSNQVIGDPAIIQSHPIAFGIRSMLALPLVVSDRSVGVLMVVNKSGGFGAADLAEVLPLLPRLSIAVELTRLSESGRFAHRADRLLDGLRVAVLGHGLDDAARDDVLARTKDALLADRIGLDAGGRIEVVRTSSPFSRAETALIQSMDAVLAEARAARLVQRHEAELAAHRERRHLADDLHDDVSQLLFAAQLALADDGGAAPDVERARTLVGRAEAALREAIFVLEAPPAPPVDEWTAMLDDLRDHWGIRIEAIVDGELDRLDVDDMREVLRACRECVANAAKHARADRIDVALVVGDLATVLVVADDGVGMGDDGRDPARGTGRSHGLRALRRRVEGRGGGVDVGDATPTGTTVRIRLPLTPA